MFDEFTFLKDRMFGEYFGFTENEVMRLCDKNGEMKFKELMKEFEKALKDESFGYVSKIIESSKKC
jgi:hypothetical protein